MSIGEEIIFPLEPQDDFGRIAAQTAKQVVIQKVREAEIVKVNYILVVGDREVDAKTVNVRTRDNQILGEKSIDEIKDILLDEIGERR